MEIKKNDEYVVEIIDNGMDGEGIAKINNQVIFIPGTIKGEKVKIIIVKVLKTHCFGKVLDIIEKSKYRQEEDCFTYKRCGGCSLRHIDYKETLNIKRQNVENLVKKTFGEESIKVEDTIGMENPYHYRNKAQYPIGLNSAGEVSIGVFAKRTHEIIPMQKCYIQNSVAEKIAFAIYKFIKEKEIPVYNEETMEGVFRHIVIKVGLRTHELMCILVVNDKKIPYESDLVDMLVREFDVKTIVKNINDKKTNVILGAQSIVLHGDGYIYDELGEYNFKISPKSFYQVNPVQAEKLYKLAIEKANLNKDDILFDLYCGIGTIGIFASKYVKKVFGIEIVEEAIKDAKENAKLNNINNIEFFAGDVEKTFDVIMKKENAYPNVVIVDPPRKGLDERTIENLLNLEAEKIVYISCNPATFVRDLKMLQEKYEIGNITPVDMFPFTSHCEVVVCLNLKG